MITWREERRSLLRITPTRARALLFLVLVFIAELLVTFADPRWGLGLHCLLLLGLLVYSYVIRENVIERNFAICLIFVPLIRILSLAAPLAEYPIVDWYLIISIPLFLSLAFIPRLLGISWRDVGFTRKDWETQLQVAFTGVAFGFLEYFILRPAPLIDALTLKALVWPVLIMFVCTGLLEEMIFRGVIQTTGAVLLPKWNLVYVSLLYAVMQIGHRSVVHVLLAFAVGGFMSWIVKRTGSLLGVVLAHGVTNIVLFLILPFLF